MTTGKAIAWLDGHWLAKKCLCFLICCLGWSYLFLQGVSVFKFHGWSRHLQWFLSQKNKGSSAFSKTSLNIWKFTDHILLKPGLENFEHYFTSVWDECNCALVWAFFSIAFLWDWNDNWPFPVLWPLLSFPNMLAYWVQHFHSIIF